MSEVDLEPVFTIHWSQWLTENRFYLDRLYTKFPEAVEMVEIKGCFPGQQCGRNSGMQSIQLREDTFREEAGKNSL